MVKKDKPKKFGWKDNFKPAIIPPSERIERPGICSNCGHGSFTLVIDKNVIPGKLKRICKGCGWTINPENLEVIKNEHSKNN
jgi:hypothetical protein